MENKHCACCKDKKSNPTGNRGWFSYNRLEGKERKWAKDRGFDTSEYCVPVKSGKRFKGDARQKSICGDGGMGFSTRRRRQDEASMEQGLDGQFKRRRLSLVTKRSSRAAASRRTKRIDGGEWGLISNAEILMMQRDPIEVARHARECRRMERRENHKKTNRNKSRRAVKRARKLVA